MLIQYVLGCNVQVSFVSSNPAEWIEKMKQVGAKNFSCFKLACTCQAGFRVIDEDGTTEPCSDCETGRRYDEMANPDKCYPF
jgi:hypothetical protein